MSPAHALRLEFFGAFRIVADGRAPIRPLTARQQQLLAYLTLHADAPIPRQQIAGCLWPDSTDAQALTNLRREWHHLHDAWPAFDAMLDAGSRTLGWKAAALPDIDVTSFERAAASGLGIHGDRAALESAAQLYTGDLFPECTDEWIHPHRERLRQLAVRVLTQLVDLTERERALGQVIVLAQQLLRIDPLNEPAWCTVMRAHAQRGERATALHLYQRCAALLREELEVQPSAATRLTYREILDLEQPMPAAALVPPRTGTYALVGRRAEWAALLQAWRGGDAGRPQLVVIRGEAGIGKTRLAEELADWCRRQGIRVATTRCYAGDGRLAYAPLAAWLAHDAVRPTLTTLDPVWLTEIARLRPELLIGRTDVPAPEPHLETWQRSRFFDALSRAIDAAAPLLLVLDDLQWSDADTLEWLHVFLRSTDGRRCLIVGTMRAEEADDNRALGPFLQELERLERLTVISLGPLDEAATATLAEEVAERQLDSQTQARTFRQTEGHPLFIVEQGRMESAGGADGDALSPRVQSVVAARLARLSDEARAVAEVAAAIGRDFSFDVVAQVSDLEEGAVVRSLDELWRRQIVRVQAGERWDFSHDRIREVAYGSIGPARTRLIHRRIAQALERTFASDLDAVSAPIATHLERGGQAARAIPFLERAAAVAMRVSAMEEAIRCLERALAIVERMPSGRDRDEHELALRTTLSGSLTSARGYGAVEVEDNLRRVVTLASALGRGDVPVRWLWSLWTVHFVLGDLSSSKQVAERALAYSRRDPGCLCEAHHAMAGTLTSLADFGAAREHFQAALAAYDERTPQRSALGSDLGVFAHAWHAHALWLSGEPEAAVSQAEEAIALARRLDHPYSEALAFAYAGLTYQLQRDAARVSGCAERVIALCDRYGFAYYGDWATALLGWVRSEEGRPHEGIGLIERALDRLTAQRAQSRRPYYMSLLAESCVAAGRRDEASAIVESAIGIALARADRWWLPELYRQKAELEPTSVNREALLRRALHDAGEQGSRSLERRILSGLSLS